MKLGELNDLIAQVAPIIGINSDGVIWFSAEATEDQKSQADALISENIANINK